MVEELEVVQWYMSVMEKGIDVKNVVKSLLDEQVRNARLEKKFTEKSSQY